MTDDEFDQWLVSHTAFWPDLTAWLAKLRRENADAPRRTLDAWRRVLAGLSLADAETASRRLYEGEHPRGFGQHAAAVLRLAGAHAKPKADPEPSYVDGQPVYRCGCCRDRGCRNVFEWQAVELDYRTRGLVGGKQHPPHVDRIVTAEWGRREWRLFALQEWPALVRCRCQDEKGGRFVGLKWFDNWMAPHVWRLGGEPWTPAAEAWLAKLEGFAQPREPAVFTQATVSVGDF